MVSEPSASPLIDCPPAKVAVHVPPLCTTPLPVRVIEPSLTVTVTAVPCARFDEAPDSVTDASSLAFHTPSAPMLPPAGWSIVSVGPAATGSAADIGAVMAPSAENVAFLSYADPTPFRSPLIGPVCVCVKLTY